MMNGYNLTNSPQEREDVGNTKGGGSELLGNGHLAIATQMLSFKGARGRGYPYLAHVLPGLTTETWGGFRLTPYEFIPHNPPLTPAERQAMNLDTAIKATKPSGVTESWPVVIMLGVLAIVVLSVGIHLSTGGRIDIGGR